MDRKLTLLSLHANSFKGDFLCLRDQLRLYVPECRVEYFFGNLDTKESNEIRSMLHQASGLETNGSDWIGLEGFLPDEFLDNPDGKRRYLLLEPYDYIFGIKWSTKKCRQLLAGYTHVIVPNDYWAEKIEKNAKNLDVRIMKNISLPFFECLENDVFVRKSRKRIECDFPLLRGKKIIYVYLTGQRIRPDRNDYPETDMQQLLGGLPEDYVLVTNSLNLRYACRKVPSDYRDRFIYIKDSFDMQELLICADFLISNNGYSCSVFASTEKPYAIAQFCDNAFEKYIAHNYRGGFITNKKELILTIEGMISGIYQVPMIKELMMNKGKPMITELLE